MTLTIYHAEGRRSERIVWLCEELGLPYTLKFKRGDLMGTFEDIRAVCPLMPVAPVVKYDDQVIVESGAILELILARQGKGRLVPPVESADYPYYLQWLHFAEGSAFARIVSEYRAGMLMGYKRPTPPPDWPKMVDSESVMRFADAFLAEHPYFGGREFSAADIMMHTVIRTAKLLNVTDMAALKNFEAWQLKVESRPAFKRTLEVSLPDGLMGVPPALKSA
jgi:glutathione S-transferase